MNLVLPVQITPRSGAGNNWGLVRDQRHLAEEAVTATTGSCAESFREDCYHTRHPESSSHRRRVMMSMVSARQTLIFRIQKRLSSLSASQLQTVARAIDDGKGTPEVEHLCEPELYDLIVNYVRSEQLKVMEDEGMTKLLILDDMIGETLLAKDTAAVDAGQTTHPLRGGEFLNQPASADRNVHTDPFMEDRAVHSPGGDFTVPTPAKSSLNGAASVPRGIMNPSATSADQVVRLTDVAALLPRREFKLHGGQISDSGSDISYVSLGRQIDEGLREGFSESEVIRTVLKITKPGVFREMLTHKDDLSVGELKRFLRSHLRDKNVTELFQELSNARQFDKESPQQFLYRVMGLKQRVLFESQQSGSCFSYDQNLVQGTFLHTLYQGLNEKNNHVRLDLKPVISDMQVSDDFLLEQITKSNSEEEERVKRLGPAKTRPVTVSIAQHDTNELTGQTKQTKVDSELQANRAAIEELTIQVSSLTKHLAQIARPSESVTFGAPGSTVIHSHPIVTESKGRCNDCVQKGNMSCPHCFICGQEGHRAIGCLQRRMQGNGGRALERGSQRPLAERGPQ